MGATYVSPEVQAVRDLHPYLRDPAFRALPIRAQLEQQARTLHKAFPTGTHGVAMHVMSWWPGAQGKTWDQVKAAPFSTSDALLTLAREYGFANNAALSELGLTTPDAPFEHALDLLLAGEHTALEAALRRTPSLATARSRFGHGATLLHYIGANGVESHRQVTPLNAPDMAKLLIAYGADVHSPANIYGSSTAHDLAITSAHPARAGVTDALCAALGTS